MMSSLLVSDTSVIIDLGRGGLIEELFRLPFSIAVPDVLFRLELEPETGQTLVELGLTVLEMDSDGVELAQRYVERSVHLSTPDAFALALAKQGGHTLLTGDAGLRELAAAESVDCHGVLWIWDEIEKTGTVGVTRLRAGLEIVAAHPRARLPNDEVRRRLERYRRLEGGKGE